MFKRVLIANRGVIACRIIRTLRALGVSPVAVYSEADRHSLHVRLADTAVEIGPAAPAQSYLSFDRILDAARATGAEAIHPGYGFLSESADFAEACAKRGVVFIGPAPAHMRAFGLKHTARELAEQNRIPLLPGSGLLSGVAAAELEAARVGYPVMLKATAGGGGIGMSLCRDASELREKFAAVERLGKGNFKDGGIYLERFVEEARHIEVQVFGDGRGAVLSLGERDCSAQRRNQKVIEETPAPRLSDVMRNAMQEAALRLTRPVQYQSAGTVEFLYDKPRDEFYFLEVNTRLQVEHGVTEEVTGIDLVEWMIRLAAGELPPLEQIAPSHTGHSIQVRVYAEEPHKNFQPSTGILSQVVIPTDVRVETWVEAGAEVTPHYDPLLAKIIVKGASRDEAVSKMREALAASRLDGIETNLDYLRRVVGSPEFADGGFSTGFLATVKYAPVAVEVLEPGTQTSVQDLRGRLGYWAVGVPPSGPMDPLAFRLANSIVGNPADAAAVECTFLGPSVKFHAAALIALTGADMGATLDGVPVRGWQPVPVAAGSVLKLGMVSGSGNRTYLAVRGGLDVPEYLGSKSTFILGKFGGHAGRTLRSGDLLRIGGSAPLAEPAAYDAPPEYSSRWEVGVLYGPHGAPDFFTDGDIEMFFSTEWRVHHHSDRTGVRLIGPKPEWARRDGGEAGLHPSNIHDNAYAVGAVDFTGDMPIILGPDGPSLGGFVCPATVVQDELWKLGQLKAGDTVRFRRLTDEPAVLRRVEDVAIRAAGDRYLLIEFGPNLLDFALRLRAHALMTWFEQNPMPGIIDLTPGIRSLQIHYDADRLPREVLIEALDAAERSLPAAQDITVPSRVVHLPLSWDDPATQLAIRKYMQSVRPDAPWGPSNIEFIRRINGLDSIEDVKRIVFDACYLVLGLGDVYLGAPVATPVDPRHRLVTTKYNPARTWTPENAVGIGGAYLCVYGMEGPGGYQFVGRTIQMWNTHRVTRDFQKGKPWLLRFFDQIRFYPVSADELMRMRDDFPQGKFQIECEETEFRFGEYQKFLASIGPEAESFKQKQELAFQEERERWVRNGQAEYIGESLQAAPDAGAEAATPPGCEAVRSPMAATVWKLAVEPGQRVRAGEKLLIIEAMKMEMVVTAPSDGEVIELRCVEGALIMSGQTLAILRPGGRVA